VVIITHAPPPPPPAPARVCVLALAGLYFTPPHPRI
jgi:hypothetical protein